MIKKYSPRLMSLDVFRGITIVLMIIVNSPGGLVPYSLLEHATWNGCTLADLVFPFFIVIVGISSVLALSNLAAKGAEPLQLLEKVFKRSIYIFLMGLLLNAFPHHFDLSSLRILGVLQRIAICYFFSAIFFLTTRTQTQLIIALFLLIGYACLMSLMPSLVPGVHPLSLEGNLAGYIDRLMFSPGHLYTPIFDPEGLLSTLPAIASVLIGNLIGIKLLEEKTKKQHLQWMMIVGGFLAFIGWTWQLVLPLNKALWSSSYVLWTSGLALLIFAVVYALIEMKQWKKWSKPFDVFGRHAMLVYMLHVFFLKIQAMIHIQHLDGSVVNLRMYLTELLFNYWSAQNASLFYSLSYTLFWFFVLLGVNTYSRRRIR